MQSAMNGNRRKKRLLNVQCLVVTGALMVTVLFLMTLQRLTQCDKATTDASVALSKQSELIMSNGAIMASRLSNQESVTMDKNAICKAEYDRITAKQVRGLTTEDLERSVAYTGNRHRLAKFIQKLTGRQEAVTVLVCGGSITLGHGVEPKEARYSDKLGVWLNEVYPLPPQQQNHTVHNRGSHGADMCALAKRVNFFNLPTKPDLFILEFAVNDYQGQDHVVYLDHKQDIFFDGFTRIAGCAETVVYRLLADYPDAAVIFLEFQTAVLHRKTAQLLHMGAAQYYKVPVLSYADMFVPDFYRLLEKLKPYDYSIPSHMDVDSVLPYPHGCARCREEDMTDQFRPDGCVSLCQFADHASLFSGEKCDDGDSHRPCYVPFFAHDEVHPSGVGHTIARDLIANFIAMTALQLCQDGNRTFTDYGLPKHSGWLVAGKDYHHVLRSRSDFVLVKDTMSIFAQPNPLLASSHTVGFDLKQDAMFRTGWISENPAGGEKVTFEVNVDIGECYVIILSVLNSYATVGTFNVTVYDSLRQTTTSPRTVDCLWKPRISIPADVQITSDDRVECTGKCQVRVITNPEIQDGRNGNLIKIMSLAVRKCMPIV